MKGERPLGPRQEAELMKVARRLVQANRPLSIAGLRETPLFTKWEAKELSNALRRRMNDVKDHARRQAAREKKEAKAKTELEAQVRAQVLKAKTELEAQVRAQVLAEAQQSVEGLTQAALYKAEAERKRMADEAEAERQRAFEAEAERKRMADEAKDERQRAVEAEAEGKRMADEAVAERQRAIEAEADRKRMADEAEVERQRAEDERQRAAWENAQRIRLEAHLEALKADHESVSEYAAETKAQRDAIYLQWKTYDCLPTFEQLVRSVRCHVTGVHQGDVGRESLEEVMRVLAEVGKNVMGNDYFSREFEANLHKWRTMRNVIAHGKVALDAFRHKDFHEETAELTKDVEHLKNFYDAKRNQEDEEAKRRYQQDQQDEEATRSYDRYQSFHYHC